jgi:hypothetical protein
VVAAVLATGSEKAAAHRLGLSHSTVKHHLANARSKVGAETTAQLVWILAARLPDPKADTCDASDPDPAGSYAAAPSVGIQPLHSARARRLAQPSRIFDRSGHERR